MKKFSESWFDLDYYSQFIGSYRKLKDRRKMVFVENFREDYKHWKAAYNPSMFPKVTAIYGKFPPKSFLMRKKIFEEQSTLLSLYSLPSTVIDKGVEKREVKKKMT